MFLCQTIEPQTDPKYRRDWRVVWYRVGYDLENKTLVWRLHEKGKWRCTRWFGQARHTGDERALRDYIRGVMVVETGAVAPFATVTLVQMKKLTGIDCIVAKDFIMDHMDDEVVFLMPKKLPKEKPTKPEPSPVEAFSAEAAKYADKLKWFDTKIKRLTTLRKKWERKAKRLAKKIEATSTTQGEAK